MKIALVRLANHLLPGGLLLVGSGIAYTLLRSLRNGTNLLEMVVAFSILAGLLTSVLGFAIWAASYADTALKRDMFRRRLAELWGGKSSLSTTRRTQYFVHSGSGNFLTR
jgi:hypothetical protein